jgi:hypothetical protein
MYHIRSNSAALRPWAFLAVICAGVCTAEDLCVSLPPGRTALTDIGLYRVWWQSYGKEPVAMPRSWTGHFDAATGISYAPWGRVLGDYAQCPEYLFADARTWFDLPYMRGSTDIEPRLKAFAYLGGDRVRVTYEWVVNETVASDYNCFVHAVNSLSAGSDRIVFQQDHGLPAPTSAWKKGRTIVDGPHEFAVSAEFDSYDLVIGLFKGERVRLKGYDGGGNRILVARLKLTRESGNVTGVACEKIAPGTLPLQSAPEADFAAHRNPEGTWVDFGTIATDGAAKVERTAEGFTIFPYPREKKFRVSVVLPAGAEQTRVKVRALTALTREDLGPVDFTFENGRLVLTVGKSGAGRYVVTWGAR